MDERAVPPSNAGPLIGRDREVALIESFLARIADGPGAIVISGESGSGKTALLATVADLASASGVAVLSARPAASERDHAYAALADLFRPVFPGLAAELPQPLADALATALLLRPSGPEIEPRLTGMATTALLEALVSQRQLLLAIDDAGWLDADSERALAFAVRRLPAAVTIATGLRDAEGSRAPLGLDQAVRPDRLLRIAASPLSSADIHHLVRRAAPEVAASRAAVLRIVERSGGNPYAAVELARAWARRGARPEVGVPLPVPATVRALVAERLDHLSQEARALVLLVSLAGRPSLASIGAIIDGVGPVLAEAEAAGALAEDGDRVRPAHPLVAMVAESAATDAERRMVHQRLAAATDDPEIRARHLAALPDAGPDTSEAIEDGAAAAMARGAPAAAADLLDIAVARTHPTARTDLVRRLVASARARLAAGDADAARTAAEAALGMVNGHERAQALADLADIAWADGTMDREAGRLREALAWAEADEELTVRLRLALVAFGVTGGPAAAIGDAEAALGLVDPAREPGRAGYLFIHRAMATALAGRGIDWQALADGIDLERLGGGMSSPPLVLYTATDEVASARARFAAEDAWYAERGEEGWRADRRGQMAMLELRAGNVAAAITLAEDAHAALERVAGAGAWPLVSAWRSLVDAHVGLTDRARTTLERASADLSTNDGLWGAIMHSVAAVIAWAAEDRDEVLASVRRMRALLDGLGVHDLLADRSEPFVAEVHADLGSTELARRELERLEVRHRALPRAWTAMALPRTRAIVLAAEGDLDGALDAIAHADATQDTELPWELAWTLHLRGRLHRRRKEKLRAAESLGRARDLFVQLGGQPWVARVDRDLARVGLRRGTGHELTASEWAIARLAAKGLTTRGIAEAAFVSPKTVEANLTRIYRKLGIGSRAELGARMRDLEAEGHGPQT